MADFDDLETGAPRALEPGTRLHALITVEGVVATRLLPESGQVTIGRSPECDLVIPHASVSRRHATLMIEPLGIIDGDSRNGTRVHGKPVEKRAATTIGIGDAIQIGEVTIVIQSVPLSFDGKPMLSERDGALPPVDAECARSARTGSPFAVVQVATEGARSKQVLALLRELLRTTDVVIGDGAGGFQIVLVETGGSHVSIAVTRITDLFETHDIKARIGVARYPDDGVIPEQLVSHAHEQLTRTSDTPSAMDSVRALVRQVATGDLSVLVLGETGVGKELYAEMIHRLSARAGKPFVKLNCSALVESLIESELFGHERGSFTGATNTHPGLLETGEGGTVFLDEIGELPLGVQAKLLRVLEERVVRRIGATTGHKVNVRFVFATNRPLGDEVDAGRFRRDLYYRINGVTIMIPPLRERRSEIVPLARAFASKAREGETITIGTEVAAALEHHAWPGNIRELRNAIERAVLFSSGGAIRPRHLVLEPERESQVNSRDSQVNVRELEPVEHRARTRESRPTIPMQAPPVRPSNQSLASAVADVERERILQVLEQCAGNQSRAAKILGISRTTLQARLDAYGVPRPRK